MFSPQRNQIQSSHRSISANAFVTLLISIIMITGCASSLLIDSSLQTKALGGDMNAQYEIGEQYRKTYFSWSGKSEYWKEAAGWYHMENLDQSSRSGKFSCKSAQKAQYEPR